MSSRVITVVFCVAASACFEPALPVGLPCTSRGSCPPDQVCVNRVCQTAVSGGADNGDGGVSVDLPDGSPCVAVANDDSTCDGIDDDCDGAFDEDIGGLQTFYIDSDNDGFGRASYPMAACAKPAGFSELDTDCWDSLDPAASQAYPGSPAFSEQPMGSGVTGDPFDWNCDGQIQYSRTICGAACAPDPRCEAGFQEEGWQSVFAECGETRPWCDWDPYKNYCYNSGDFTQSCR